MTKGIRIRLWLFWMMEHPTSLWLMLHSLQDNICHKTTISLPITMGDSTVIPDGPEESLCCKRLDCLFYALIPPLHFSPFYFTTWNSGPGPGVCSIDKERTSAPSKSYLHTLDLPQIPLTLGQRFVRLRPKIFSEAINFFSDQSENTMAAERFNSIRL